MIKANINQLSTRIFDMIIIILLPPVTCTSSQWGWPAQSCSIFHQILAIGLAPFVINWQKLIKLMIACYWMSKARILIMTLWHYIKFKCLWMIWKELHFNIGSRMNLELHLVLDSIAAGGGGERNALNDLDLRSGSFSFKPTITVILSPNSINKINK